MHVASLVLRFQVHRPAWEILWVCWTIAEAHYTTELGGDEVVTIQWSHLCEWWIFLVDTIAQLDGIITDSETCLTSMAQKWNVWVCSISIMECTRFASIKKWIDETWKGPAFLGENIVAGWHTCIRLDLELLWRCSDFNLNKVAPIVVVSNFDLSTWSWVGSFQVYWKLLSARDSSNESRYSQIQNRFHINF